MVAWRWIIIGIALLVAGCGRASTDEQIDSRTTDVSLLAVPYSLTVPATAAEALRIEPVQGSWIDELGPLAATQVNLERADGHAAFLANVFWFDAARLRELSDPSQPPPGITMATVGDRALVVAVTVEMPFDPESTEGRAYGRLSEVLRDRSSYHRFACPQTANLVSRPLSPVIRDVVTAYLQGKELLPVRFDGDVEQVLDVQANVEGTHVCLNDGGGESAYVGAVPPDATAAVQVYAHHAPYPVTQAASTFITLASVDGAWRIVAESTSP